MTLCILEESTQWANFAENYVGFIKQAVCKDLAKSNAPLVLWYYCVERRAIINNLTARNVFQLDVTNPHLTIHDTEGDILNIRNYRFYEWIYYWDQGQPFPHQKQKLGRVLGPAKNHGNEMCQFVLIANGKVVPCCLTQPLKQAELFSLNEIHKRDIITKCIKDKLGDSINVPPDQDPKHPDYVPCEDNEEKPRSIPENDIHPINISLMDALINSEVLLHHGEKSEEDVVKGDCLAKVLQKAVVRFRLLVNINRILTLPEN